jgi:hypothetical protein
MSVPKDEIKNYTEKIIQNITNKHNNSKILIFFNKNKYNNSNIEFPKSENITIINTGTNPADIKGGPFNVIIEAPFINSNTLLLRRDFFDKTSNDNYFYSIVNKTSIIEIETMNKENSFFIKIINLISKEFAISQSESIKNNEEELLGLDEIFINEKTKTLSNISYKNIDKLTEIIMNNQVLSKKIIELFLNQNYEKVFKKDDEQISLISGEKGLCTVKLTPLDSRQIDE